MALRLGHCVNGQKKVYLQSVLGICEHKKVLENCITEQNVHLFLDVIKEKYSLQSFHDWNLITRKQIISNGGSKILNKHSLYELKCMGFPEGKFKFNKPKKVKPSGYWENRNNIYKFINILKEKYNLHSPKEWNSITQKQIKSNGGGSLLNQYSVYDIKCLACPEGKDYFDKPYHLKGFWDDKQNIIQFLKELKEHLNLHTPNDWNLITKIQIEAFGGRSLLNKYSMYEIKCLGCPEGKPFFYKPHHESGFWDNEQNIIQFLDEIKEKYSLNSAEDWNLLTGKKIQENGGKTLLNKYSMYEIKCFGCPEGKSIFDKKRKTIEYWNDEENRSKFLTKLKTMYNLTTPQDWNRLSAEQIKLYGGLWLFNKKMKYMDKIRIEFEINNDSTDITNVSYSLKELIGSKSIFNKRSSQRWLFLQVQKLYPNEEIVEDYFHSEISRESGSSVQFDIYLTKNKIAIEYHGKQHYEDIPSGFAPLEMHQNRDLEKQKICSRFGIQLIVIPYWWDKKLDSLRKTLNSLNKDIS